MPTLAQVRHNPWATGKSDEELIFEIAGRTGRPPEVVAYDFGLDGSRFVQDDPGLTTAFQNSLYGLAGSLGQVGQDVTGGRVGKDLERWGDMGQYRNPVTIMEGDSDSALSNLGSNLVDQPFNTVGQVVGSAAGYMVPGGALKLGVTGLRALRGAEAVAGASRLAEVGKTAADGLLYGLPSYGGIRDTQEEMGYNSAGDMLLAAGGALASGMIEGRFGPEAILDHGKIAPFIQGPGKNFFRTGLKTGAVEAGEELMQNPIEQLASYQNPLDADNIDQTLAGGVAGFVGGKTFGMAAHPFMRKPLDTKNPHDLLGGEGVVSEPSSNPYGLPSSAFGADLFADPEAQRFIRDQGGINGYMGPLVDSPGSFTNVVPKRDFSTPTDAPLPIQESLGSGSDIAPGVFGSRPVAAPPVPATEFKSKRQNDLWTLALAEVQDDGYLVGINQAIMERKYGRAEKLIKQAKEEQNAQQQTQPQAQVRQESQGVQAPRENGVVQGAQDGRGAAAPSQGGQVVVPVSPGTDSGVQSAAPVPSPSPRALSLDRLIPAAGLSAQETQLALVLNNVVNQGGNPAELTNEQIAQRMGLKTQNQVTPIRRRVQKKLEKAARSAGVDLQAALAPKKVAPADESMLGLSPAVQPSVINEEEVFGSIDGDVSPSSGVIASAGGSQANWQDTGSVGDRFVRENEDTSVPEFIPAETAQAEEDIQRRVEAEAERARGELMAVLQAPEAEVAGEDWDYMKPKGAPTWEQISDADKAEWVTIYISTKADEEALLAELDAMLPNLEVKNGQSRVVEDRAQPRQGSAAQGRPRLDGPGRESGPGAAGTQGTEAQGSEPSFSRETDGQTERVANEEVQGAEQNIAYLERGIKRHLGEEASPERAYAPARLPSGELLGRLASAWGARIQGFRTVGNRARYGFFNGVYFDGNRDVIYLNVDSRRPHVALLGHELVHYLRRNNPELFARFKEQVFQYVKAGEYQAWSRLFTEKGDKLKEEFLGEVVSDGFMNRTFWEAVGRNNPSLLKRVVAIVNKLVKDALAAIGYTPETKNVVSDFNRVMEIAGEVMAKAGSGVDTAEQTYNTGAQVSAMANQSEGVALSVDKGAALDQEQSGVVRVIYRGTNDSGERISGGIAEGTLFAAADEATAKNYAGTGGKIERIGVKQDAKVLVEGTKEFAQVTGRRRGKLIDTMRKGENLKTAADDAAAKARAAGYDALEFTSLKDLGIAIFNEDKFVRDYSPSQQIKSATGNRGTFDPENPDIRFSRSTLGNTPPTPPQNPFSRNITDQVIEAAPAPAQKAMHTVVDTLEDLSGRTLNYSMFTNDLVEKVSDVLTSAKAWYEGIRNRETLRIAHEAKVDDIANLVDQLPAAKFNRTWGLIKDMTKTGKWGYAPTWRKDVTVDPAMQERYNALDKDEQSVIDAVFKMGDETIRETQAALDALADEIYGEKLAAAKDDRTRAKLEKEKGKFKRVFRKDLSVLEGPYAPMRRVGSYVTAAKSARYADLEKQAANGDTKAADELLQLRSDGKHYQVVFSDSLAQARAVERELHAAGFPRHLTSASAKEVFTGEDQLPFQAFEQIRQMALAKREKGKDVSKLMNLVDELYLTSLADTSARKSELRRTGVEGLNPDTMYKAFLSKGKADAHYLSILKTHQQVSRDFTSMREEARSLGNRADKMDAFNELKLRYENSFNFDPSPLIGRLMNISAMWYLMTKPAYYLYNLTQPLMMAQPYIAQEHGYGAASGAMTKAYNDLLRSQKMLNLTHLDVTKLPEDIRQAMVELRDAGRIDITITQDLGSRLHSGGNKVSKALSKVERALRTATQKTEMVNRIVTAAAAYRLELAKTKDHAAAVEYAKKVVDRTQGDYSNFNAPRLLNATNFRKLITQFRKFQFIQASLLIRMVNDSLRSATPHERAMARRALMFTLGHHAVLAGALGLPLANVVAMAFSMTGGEDEPRDLELWMRRELGDNALADLLMHGVPAVFNVNVSSNVGMGQTFSVVPFADFSLNRDGFESVVTSALGPVFGLGRKGWEAMGKAQQGDYYGFLAGVLPGAASSSLKAVNEFASGVENKRGDVLVNPEEISFMDSVVKALGFKTQDDTIRQLVRGQQYEFEQFFKEHTTEIKKAYTEAYRDGDHEEMMALRERWQEMQEFRREYGFKPQPLSALLKAPAEQRKREAQTIGGVQYNSGNKGFVAENAAP